MAIAVNNITTAIGIATATPITIPNTAGNLIVLLVSLGSAGPLTGISDGTNTYVSAGTHQNPPGSGEIWYAKNAVAGITSVTPSWASGANGWFAVFDLNGADPTSPLDGYAQLSSQSATANITGPAITPTTNRGIVITGLNMSAGTISGVNAPFNFISLRAVGGGAYYLNPPASSTAATWANNSNTWGGVVASFMPPTLIYPGNMTPGTDVAWRIK